MCGIIGGVSSEDIIFKLVKGLEVIEYRGYDSANIVILNSDQRMHRHAPATRVHEIYTMMKETPLSGTTGIGNTNWVRNTSDIQENINPYVAFDEIALALNGIIENKKFIRDFLTEKEFTFTHETDVEILGYLVYYFIRSGQAFVKAVRSAVMLLEGSFSVCFMLRTAPERLVAVRRGSSLVIGLGENENFVSSDHLALLPLINKFIYLEDGDLADIRRNEITVFDEEDQLVTRPVYLFDRRGMIAKKGKYSHFMFKDIADQPDAILSTLQGRVSDGKVLIESFGKEAPGLFERIQRVHIVAEGASYHAALIGRHWIEEIAAIPCEVSRPKDNYAGAKLVDSNTLFMTISQNGESRGALMALMAAKYLGYIATMTIGNMPESSLVNESDFALITGEGPETIATSTKAFTVQLCALFLLAIGLGRYHSYTPEKENHLVAQLANLPRKIQQTLDLNSEILKLSKSLYEKNKLLFLASDIQFPVALEAASRITELSHMQAKASSLYNLDQVISLVSDPMVPVITLASSEQKLNRIMLEMLERAQNLVVFADESLKINATPKVKVFKLPQTERLFSPITSVIPMQLLAYHVSLMKGAEVDKPYFSPSNENTFSS